jgi:phosphoserine phosphatase
MPATEREPVLITVTGPDRPGITAELTSILAEADVELLDLEQAVIQGFLNLHLLVQVESSTRRPIFGELLWKARELGVHIDFVVRPPLEESPSRTEAWAVTIVKDQIGAGVVAATTRAAADHGFNVDKIERLSRGRLASIEFILGGRDAANVTGLQKALLELEQKHGCDVALQREGLLRRSKRLVVMDMDSTLIQQEVIDEIARIAGVYEEVAKVTERAMNGEIGFDEALRERCQKLAGTPASVFDEVSKTIQLTPGADVLVRALKRLGYRLAVISGGFVQVVEPLRQQLGLDYAFANELEVVDGRITGRVIGPIVNRQRKADLLESVAQAERISLEQVIAIGDGANDLDMLARAGLGIAFNAKRSVQAQAQHKLNQRNLDAVLYLLGIREDEIARLISMDSSRPSG